MFISNQNYHILDTIRDKYFFAGPNWTTQISRRFILNVTRLDKPIESSIYLHLDKDDEAINVAFEPSISFGCQPRCTFCASGNLFPISSLNKDEIVSQINSLISEFDSEFPNLTNIRKDVFFAGIGEPTLVAKKLIEASQEACASHKGLGIKISTMGARPDALARFAESNIPVRSLQIGVPHWNNDVLRNIYSNVPKYRLEDFLSAVALFKKARSETTIKINYVMMQNVNDTYSDFEKTADMIKQFLGTEHDFKISCLNPTSFGDENGLHPVTVETLEKMADHAKSHGFERIYLFGPMSSEKLGCGQLAGSYVDDSDYGLKK